MLALILGGTALALVIGLIILIVIAGLRGPERY